MATVQNVIDQIKWQADLQNGGRLANIDLIPEINDAYLMAWEAIVTEYEDYFVKKATDFVIAGGVGANTYALTTNADFFKVKALQRLNGTTFGAPLPTHEFNETGVVSELSYRVADDTLYLEPELSCNGTYRLWYVYTPVALAAAGDNLVDKANGAVKRFCIDLVVARCVSREEEDSSFAERMVKTMLERIKVAVSNRNAGRGHKIADVRRQGRWRFMTRSGYHLP